MYVTAIYSYTHNYMSKHTHTHTPLAPSKSIALCGLLSESAASPFEASMRVVVAVSTMVKVGGMSTLSFASLVLSSVCLPT